MLKNKRIVELLNEKNPSKYNFEEKSAEARKLFTKSKYFNFSIPDKLLPNWNFLIFSSARLGGKTTAIINKIKELKEGEKFIFMRISAEQLKESIKFFKSVENAPYVIIGTVAYRKEYDEDTQKLLPTKELKEFGRFVSYRNFANLNSGFGDGYSWIFFDEFVSHDQRKILSVNVNDFYSAYISITRNTPNVKTVLFANNIYESLFLEELKIPYQTETYYENITTWTQKIGRKKEIREFKLLYINAGNYLNNLETSNSAGFTNFISHENKTLINLLKQNKTLTFSDKIIGSLEIRKSFKPIFAFVLDDKIFTYYKHHIYDEEYQTMYWINYLDLNYIYNFQFEHKFPKCTIVTNSIKPRNLYPDKINFIDKKTLIQYASDILDIAKAGILFLDKGVTIEEFEKILK